MSLKKEAKAEAAFGGGGGLWWSLSLISPMRDMDDGTLIFVFVCYGRVSLDLWLHCPHHCRGGGYCYVFVGCP